MHGNRSSDVGWLLTLEPVGGQLGWSLLRSDDSSTRLVDVGWLTSGERLQAVAQTVRPRIDAPPTEEGLAGVWASGLCDPGLERHAAISLGLGLLPRRLREALLAQPANAPQTLTLATRGWPAAVPWDALSLTPEGDLRLVERAVVVGGLSPAQAVGRARVAPQSDAGGVGLAVIDPGPVVDRPLQLYPHGYPQLLTGTDGLPPDEVVTPQTRGTTAQELAFLLHQQPARLLYLGHIQAAPDDVPGAAALVLSGSGGVIRLTAREWLAAPLTWPAPRRVALIGCASNDTLAYEQSGLVVAAINSGAQLVTSTRWPLPVDHQPPAPLSPATPVHHQGLTALALAVSRAHRSVQPLEQLRAWQLEQLRRWRVTHLLQYSPLLWASLVSYLAPEPAESIVDDADAEREPCDE